MPQALKLTDRKRQAILNAAIELFLEKGFAATSMDKIAEKAEVSKRTVYNHFANKDALFQEILDQLWKQSEETVDYKYYAEQPLAEQLQRIIKGKIELFASAPYMDLARVALVELMLHSERSVKLLEAMGKKELGLNEWLQNACADHRLNCRDIDFAANQLHSMIKSMAFWPQLLQAAPPISEEQVKFQSSEIINMFLGYYTRH